MIPLEKASTGPSELLAEMVPCLRAVLRAFRVPCQDWEDLLQDVFVLYLLKFETVRLPGPWLFQVARHRCCRYWAAHRRAHSEASEAVLRGVARESGASEPERRIDFRRAVEALPKSARLVVSNRYWQGRSLKETAEQTGLSEGSIDKTARRALSRLSRRLAKDYSPADGTPAALTSGAELRERQPGLVTARSSSTP